MNELIKQFIEQAGAEELDTGSDLYGGPFIGAIRMDFLEKFAELIIKECCFVAGPEDSYTDEWFKSKVDSIAKIKKHFGVEE